MSKSIALCAIIILVISFGNVSAQARLTIINKSERYMTVKIMRGESVKGTLFKTAAIQPQTSSTIYFSSTGYYFVKSRATVKGREPIYKKGNPFHVYNGTDGYDVLTLTYTIKESAYPNPMEGRSISKTEFDEN